MQFSRAVLALIISVLSLYGATSSASEFDVVYDYSTDPDGDICAATVGQIYPGCTYSPCASATTILGTMGDFYSQLSSVYGYDSYDDAGSDLQVVGWYDDECSTVDVSCERIGVHSNTHDDHDVLNREFSRLLINNTTGVDPVTATDPQVREIYESLADAMTATLSMESTTSAIYSYPETSGSAFVCDSWNMASPSSSSPAQEYRWDYYATTPLHATFNVGILNQALYLFAEGGTLNGFTITGQGRSDLAEILEASLSTFSGAFNFDGIRNLLVTAAMFTDYAHGEYTYPRYHAMDDATTAVGLWDVKGQPSTTGFSTVDATTAIVLEDAAGTPRLYLFWRGVAISGGATNSGLHWAVYDGSSWSSDHLVPGVQMQGAPYTVHTVAGGTISPRYGFVFYAETSTDKVWEISLDGNYPTAPLGTLYKTGGTTVTLYSNRGVSGSIQPYPYIMLAYGDIHNVLKIYDRSTGTIQPQNWNGTVKYITDSPVTMAGAGRYWLFYRPSGSTQVWYTSTTTPQTNSGWTTPVQLNTSYTDDPSVSSLRMLTGGVVDGKGYLALDYGSHVGTALVRFTFPTRSTTITVTSRVVHQNLYNTGSYGAAGGAPGSTIELDGVQHWFYQEVGTGLQRILWKTRAGF